MTDEEDDEGNIPLFSDDIVPVEREATTHQSSTSDGEGYSIPKPVVRY